MPGYADHEFSAFSGKELVVRLERGGSWVGLLPFFSLIFVKKCVLISLNLTDRELIQILHISFTISCQLSNFSLVQRILEHVVTAIPAAGPHVLPLAKVLMDKLVDNSSDLDTAKKNGRAAIVFLTKLSSIIALEVPQGREEVQALQWKDLPLIPVGKEIHEPSKSFKIEFIFIIIIGAICWWWTPPIQCIAMCYNNY